jgi:5'-3' exonuclease, N-terminal resolvase-like domain/Glycosyl hydrolase family 20, catalytic domain
MKGASDHVPVWVKLRNAPDRGGARLRQASGQTTSAAATALPERSTRRTGEGTGRRAARAGQSALSRRPLLVVDGDSFAHRSYHALPKTIRRSDGKGAGAIVGFANFLLRFYADEQPRAVIVGWDTLEAPTKRREMYPAYQSGRCSTRSSSNSRLQTRMRQQILVVRSGFEADDFLAAAVAAEERAGVPGHSLAILRAYPEFASGEVENRDYFSAMGSALNPAKPETFTFLGSLLGEMATLFPDQYFHVGGDEISGADWKARPRRRMCSTTRRSVAISPSD